MFPSIIAVASTFQLLHLHDKELIIYYVFVYYALTFTSNQIKFVATVFTLKYRRCTRPHRCVYLYKGCFCASCIDSSSKVNCPHQRTVHFPAVGIVFSLVKHSWKQYSKGWLEREMKISRWTHWQQLVVQPSILHTFYSYLHAVVEMWWSSVHTLVCTWWLLLGQ